MGDPKFSLGGMSFPLDRFSRFDFTVMPTRSGGILVRERIEKCVVDWLQHIKGKPEVVTRIRIPGTLCGDKKIMVHEDWVQVGDRMYTSVKKVRRLKR